MPGGAEVCGSLWSQKSALSCTLTVENKSVLVLQAPQRFQTLGYFLRTILNQMEPCKTAMMDPALCSKQKSLKGLLVLHAVPPEMPGISLKA